MGVRAKSFCLRSKKRQVGTAGVSGFVDVKNKKVVAERKKKLVFERFSIIIVSATVVLAVFLVTMRMFGYNIYTVMSGSMEPNIPVGAMIYVKAVDYKTLEVGDVISYVSDSNNTVVTHRITEIEQSREDVDELRFRTQGDANNVEDG